MADAAESKPVERMFPFVLRARVLIPGRDNLSRSKSSLQFILLTEDVSGNRLEEILREFAHYPVVQRYTSEQLETYFAIKGAKVVGFKKSDLSRSIYAELKAYRINAPMHPSGGEPKRPEQPGSASGGDRDAGIASDDDGG